MADINPKEPNPYQYEALHTPDAIRVLKLLPGCFGSPLKCEILEVRKSEDPSFEALSYTWGEPVFPRIVQDAKSNTVIRITENLSDALNGLRYEATERILWIDQICVNQMNMPEKSHQVANMGDIYRIATKTLVWLGKDDENDTIDVLESIGRDIDRFGFSKVFPFPQGVRDSAALAHFEMFVKSCKDFNISGLFLRGWFERVWVVQEFILAKDLSIYCGRRSITYDHFSKALCVLSLFSKRPTLQQLCVTYNPRLLQTLFGEDAIKGWLRAWGLVQHRERYIAANLTAKLSTNNDEKVHHDSIIEFFINAKDLKCFLPHDRVYGMLGFANKSFQVVPDYSLNPETLWTDLAMKCLEGGDLTVLHYAGKRTDSHESDNFSFVTDFSKPNYNGFRLGGRGTPKFHAGGSGVKPRVQLEEIEASIRFPVLSGFIVDEIANHVFISTKEDGSFSLLNEEALTKVFSIFDKWRETGPDGYPEESFLSAFARTIVVDNADRTTNSAFGPLGKRNDPSILLYFALVVFSIFGERRMFTPDQMVASVTGPVSLGMATFEGEEPYYYQFPAEPDTRITVPSDDGSKETTIVEIKGPLIARLQTYLQAVSVVMSDRSIFITEKGYVGLGQKNIQQGDVVFVPIGAETPFVMERVGIRVSPKERVTAGNEQLPVFRLVGECYLHGWMDGEALESSNSCEAADVLLM
jgi:hypothetical protein